MIKLSLILPVYNVEQYLARCIESCLNQDIPKSDYEIIVVIDGSTDNSLAVAKAYAEKYSNISIIEQENRGLSGARNSGLKAAKGEYVWFIDSDDWIEDNCLSSILAQIYKNNLDCIFVNYQRVNEKLDVINLSVFNSNQPNNINSGKDFFKRRPGDFVMAWRYITKRSIFIENNVKFFDRINYEDDESTPRLLYFINSIGTNGTIVYNYFFSGNSMSSSYQSKPKWESYYKVLENLSQFRDNHVVDAEYKDLLNIYLLGMVSGILNFLANDKAYRKEGILRIKRISPLKYSRNMNLHLFIKYMLVRFLPGFYSQNIRMYNNVKKIFNKI